MNAYRILHYIPRIEGVHPHQVTHFVRIFDALVKKVCVLFFNYAHLHITFLLSLYLQLSETVDRSPVISCNNLS